MASSGQRLQHLLAEDFSNLFFCFSVFLFTFFLFSLLLFSFTVHAANFAVNQQKTFVATEQCNAQNIQAQQQNALNQLIPAATEQSIKLLPVKYKPVKQYSYKIINRFSHDETAFTQGLVFYNNELYESTGLLGQSEIRKLDVTTGKITHKNKLDKYHFGEGISIVNNRLVQLTWKTERAFVYDVEQLRHIEDFSYEGEGWGITAVNNQLLMSDGTSTLKWLNNYGKKQADIRYDLQADIKVNENGIAIQGLNELEYANGFIYANVWPGDCIAQIDPATGNINAWINLTGLYPENLRPHWTAILNGIAYHQETPYFFVTGKYWPYIYEIEFLAPDKTGLQQEIARAKKTCRWKGK